MGRQPRKQAIPATDLLNFHFSTPITTTTVFGPTSRPEHFNRTNNNRRPKSQNYRSAQDRAAARRRASSANFYLHSSSEHSFALTRQTHSKIQGGEAYTFSGCDSNVSWESVRIVKHSIPIDHRNPDVEVPCPICLCHFTCPRVTKCGHTFCLPCILHHVESTSSKSRGEVKCPCCSIALSIDDLRPVIIQRTIPPRTQNFIRLQKLHRQKGCCAPYLPLREEPMHSNPHTAPCQSDPDASFSRFNYVDPILFRSLLEENRYAMLQEIKTTPPDTLDYAFLTMALEIVAGQEQNALYEFQEEVALQARFATETCGMYQRQSPAFMYILPHSKEHSAPSLSTAPLTSCDVTAAEDIAAPEDSPVCCRDRQGSVSSSNSVYSKSSITADSHSVEIQKPHPSTLGNMYLHDADAVHFYQAEDGQLVFLNGFNMVCLGADFSKTLPAEGMQPRPPFPDYVSGQILEVQHVHLTPDVRKRMPFLEHIPLYSDITFVELDLSNIMSRQTKKQFKGDIEKRRKKRQNKAKAEKRADRSAKLEEARLITERKARLNLIDPSDEFFQSPLSLETEFPIMQDVGSPDGNGADDALLRRATGNVAVPRPFLEACRRSVGSLRLESENNFPGLQRGPESFPALCHSSTQTRGNQESSISDTTSRTGSAQLSAKEPGKKKGGSGQKVVLFSTGGQRGYNF